MSWTGITGPASPRSPSPQRIVARPDGRNPLRLPRGGRLEHLLGAGALTWARQELDAVGDDLDRRSALAFLLPRAAPQASVDADALALAQESLAALGLLV